MNNVALIEEINKNMAIVLPGNISLDELQTRLSAYVNELIQNDFQHLITLLYRIDVSEPKLKKLLEHNPQEEAGKIIAALIIERQLQKIESRKHFNNPDDNVTDEEKW